MNYSTIKESISNYIETDNEYALCIDGEWGTGKTYFINNDVIPEYNRPNIKITYFSVFGYDTLQELKSDISSKLLISLFDNNEGKMQNWFSKASMLNTNLSKLSKKYASISSAVESIGSISKAELIKRKSEGEKKIVFIDDLERISESINVEDFLGYILTDLIEEFKCKVIIIGNLAKLEKKDSAYFEKVVGRTLPFSHDMNIIEESFFRSSKSPFIKSDYNWLTMLLQSYVDSIEDINLRTLQFILENFTFVEKETDNYIKRNRSVFTSQEISDIKKTIF